MHNSEEKKIERLGENIARGISSCHGDGARSALRTLEADVGRLCANCRRLERRYPGESAPEGVRRLLDELWLVRREAKSCAEAYRSAQRLRVSNGQAVVSIAAGAIVRAENGSVCRELTESFLRGFQRVIVLELAELELLRASLCAALIGLLAQESTGVVRKEQVERIIASLRETAQLQQDDVMQSADLARGILQRDPAGVFALMDERTRAYYRAELERIAHSAHIPAHRAAKRVLELAQSASGSRRHVGYWIFTRPLGNRPVRRSGFAYIAANVLLTVFFSLLPGAVSGGALCALLALVPVSELVKSAVDAFYRRGSNTRFVPRLELAQGVPPEGRTLCVISALLTTPERGAILARRLELFRLANRDCGENLCFGILADLAESERETEPQDEIILAAAKREVDALNEKYGGGFYLFCRGRSFDGRDGVYRGAERKRGAITELAKLLCSRESALEVRSGNEAELCPMRYIITLDEDTCPGPGSARELIGAMLHPLNTPRISRRTNTVVAGHGILQPRMGVSLSDARASLFAQLFAGPGGRDPYGAAAPELYMDAFGSANFAGKGIIDAAAYLRCTEGRFPEGQVLSHDAPESACLRAGFIGDVQFTDGFPHTAAGYFKRLERWTRGDWQNLPWLFRTGRGLSAISRWRLFDSLRRSLVSVMSLVSLTGAVLFPRSLAPAGLAAAVCLALPLISALHGAFVRGEAREKYSCFVPHGISGAFLQTGARLALLPFEALACAHGAITALWRLLVSHRGLLSWETAAQAGNSRGVLHTQGACLSLLAGVLCAISASVPGAALALLWFAGPALAHFISRKREETVHLSARERGFLLDCARDIWSWFAQFCTQEDNFLPPDNYREAAPEGVAHRTSPTNIGLYFAACVCACELGLEPREEVLVRVRRALSSAEHMPKWRGHFYNWYDTRTLRVLSPAYVSSVDSGNLAAGLEVLAVWLARTGETELAEKAEQLLSEMDFSPLYDEKAALFSIGQNASATAPDKGHYDLFASEARLTSFLCVARGDVPVRHWQALSRAVVGQGGFRGCVSWSGSVFEYLMPELFLPLRRGSLMWETAQFCLRVQRQKTAACGAWGCSESAFFAPEDTAFGYRAHGCAELALCRGMDKRRVFSPYSSFLALAASAGAAVQNLHRFECAGMRCRFGFWEALDETPERAAQEPGPVRCVMVHHLGMSLIAIANLLENGLCRELFMQRAENAAFRELLEESPPLGWRPLRAFSGAQAANPEPGEERESENGLAPPLPGTV